MADTATSTTPPSTAARRAARRAGLQWVHDGLPGLCRVAHRNGFRYCAPDGRAVRDAEVLERIRRLAIPPAWREVWICALPDGHLQATGRDTRGRKQYRYHAAWQAGRGQTKFDGLLAFGEALPRIRARVRRDLRPAASGALPHRAQVLATLVALLDTTWLRIGNDEYARSNRSYGLSTLRRRHAGLRGDQLRLSFNGKSGVRHDVTVEDPRVARVVRQCRELPGQELFQYLDDAGAVHRIGSADVNTWLAEAAGLRVTAKDFRTWHGSALALQLTLEACAPGAATCRPAEIVAAVAKRLGNTPAVCRKAYIHPRVLALGEALGDEAARAALAASRWAQLRGAAGGLSAPERRLMAFLHGRSGP